MTIINNGTPAILGGAPAVRNKLPPWPVVSDGVISAALKSIEGGKLSETCDEGYNLELEEIFKQYHGSKYAITVNSGTSALDAAVFAAGVGAGDEVIATSLCPGYAVTPILHLNGIPVFVDVDPKTGCMDPGEIENNITPSTKAIMVVHLNGHPADMQPIMEIAARHGLKVIEDCAHSQGSSYYGRKCGTLGHIAAFSLQSVKNLPGGEGGMILTDDTELYDRAMLVGHHPARLVQCLSQEEYKRYQYTGLGWNHRIHRVAAAIAVEQMKSFDETMQLRRHNAEAINAGLAELPGVNGTYVKDGCIHTYYAQMVTYDPGQLDDLPVDAFVKALSAEGVPMVGPIDVPVHTLSLFRDRNFYGKGCPWTCPFGGTKRSYDSLDLPNMVELRRTSLAIGYCGGFVSKKAEDIEQIVEAFYKVAENAAKICKALML